MTATTLHTTDRELLFAYLENALEPGARAALAARLSTELGLQRELERCRELHARLAVPDARAAEIDVWPAVQAELGRAAVRPRGRRRAVVSRMVVWWAAGLAAAGLVGALVLTFALRRSPAPAGALAAREAEGSAAHESVEAERLPGMHARGSAATDGARSAGGSGLDRWVALEVYTLSSARGTPARLGEVLPRGAGVLLAYKNMEQPPFAFLAALIVDGAGRVHWLYPSDAPRAAGRLGLPIERAMRSRELPELIRPALAPGPAVLYGLFSQKPWSRPQIETALAQVRAAHAPPDRLPLRLPLAGTAQHVHRFTVTP